MAKYILQRGTHDGFDAAGNRKVFQKGDVVELTDAQAAAFKDKFVGYAEQKAAETAEAEAVARAAQVTKEAEAAAKAEQEAAKAAAEAEAEKAKAKEAADKSKAKEEGKPGKK